MARRSIARLGKYTVTRPPPQVQRAVHGRGESLTGPRHVRHHHRGGDLWPGYGASAGQGRSRGDRRWSATAMRCPTRPRQAWEHWARKGVAQFRQPHNFMPGLRVAPRSGASGPSGRAARGRRQQVRLAEPAAALLPRSIAAAHRRQAVDVYRSASSRRMGVRQRCELHAARARSSAACA